jgi:hypothetical protein
MLAKSDKTPFVTEDELRTWIVRARPEDELEYYRGFLTIDVNPLGSRLAEAEQRGLRRVKDCAWQASQNGLVHLLQRRHGPNDYAYFAVRRPRRMEPDLHSASRDGAS